MGESGSQQPSFRAESLSRILVFALLVPMLIWWLNNLLFRFRLFNSESLLIGCYILFVLEIALIAWSVGHFLRHPVLRCIVFLWCILFVDVMFVLFRFTVSQDLNNVGYAFASAQLGLLIAWAVLGSQSLGIRVFAGLCGTTGVMLYVTALSTGFVLHSNFGRNDWDSILSWQAVATLGLCFALRWRRFRILPTNDKDVRVDRGSDQAEPQRVQFSILNVLMWTLALAPIFAVARMVQWDAIEIPTITRWAQFSSLAILLSLTPLVATWSGLGTGNVLLRISVALIYTSGTGAALAYATLQSWLRHIDIGIYTFRYRFTTQAMFEMNVFWISWTVLAGFFYFSLLLILRATNHRLIRVSKRSSA